MSHDGARGALLDIERALLGPRGSEFCATKYANQRLRLLNCRGGQGLTEYILVLMMVSIVCIGVVTTLGSRIKSKIIEASNHINSDISIDAGGNSDGGLQGSKHP